MASVSEVIKELLRVILIVVSYNCLIVTIPVQLLLNKSAATPRVT